MRLKLVRFAHFGADSDRLLAMQADAQSVTPPARLDETLPALQDLQSRCILQTRWQVVRELATFQFKLFVDGLKDLVLSPLSIVAALIGLISPRQSGRVFGNLYGLGRRLDHFIDLFSERKGQANGDSLEELIAHAQRTLANLRGKAQEDPSTVPEVEHLLEELSDLAKRSGVDKKK